ncbi:O-antigen ligase family protein [Vibrio europaeus]|uniref:O-antigen ligase family protein n=1 Tax=Vibrio europaeus TaxID=300876 RepID=UPI00148DF8A5|nr:O-antigen ligase family protein [Vibrio europaeus]NOH24991.1 O-antigen ligase family protein [Vibrio europaeus]
MMEVKKSWLIYTFFVFSALFLSRSFTFMFEREEGIGSSSSFQLIALLVYILSSYILINSARIQQFIYESRYILGLITLMFLSVLWSDLPNKTLSRSIAMLGTLIFSYAVYKTLSVKQFVNLLLVVFGVGAFISLFLALFVPALGIHAGETSIDHIGLWKGVYGFKNHLGRFMVILTFCVLSLFLINKRLTLVQVIIFLAAFVCTVKAGSSTAFMLLVLCPFILFFSLFVKNRSVKSGLKVVAILLFFMGLIFAIFVLPWIVTEVFQKDMTGSGRTLVWEALFNASQRPWIGHGFGGVFWGEYNSAYYLLDEDYYNLGHAHNGIVDIWLELGYIGTSFYLFLNFKVIYQGFKRTVLEGDEFSSLFFITTLFIVLYTLSGGGFVKQNNMMWVLFCVSWFYLHSERNQT